MCILYVLIIAGKKMFKFIYMNVCLLVSSMPNTSLYGVWYVKFGPTASETRYPKRRKAPFTTLHSHIHTIMTVKQQQQQLIPATAHKRPWKQKSRIRKKETKTRHTHTAERDREEMCSTNSQNHTEWQEIDVDIVANYDKTPKRWYYTNM